MPKSDPTEAASTEILSDLSLREKHIIVHMDEIKMDLYSDEQAQI